MLALFPVSVIGSYSSKSHVDAYIPRQNLENLHFATDAQIAHCNEEIICVGMQTKWPVIIMTVGCSKACWDIVEFHCLLSTIVIRTKIFSRHGVP